MPQFSLGFLPFPAAARAVCYGLCYRCAEDRINLGRSVIMQALDCVRVAIEGESDGVMPQPLLRHLRMHAGNQQRGSVSMPQGVIVDGDAEPLRDPPEIDRDCG